MKLKLRSSHRIVDERNRIIMAEGRMALLEAIVKTGSINQAAKLMGMSYKSAWSKIRSTEAHFKTKIVHSERAAGTRLTDEGNALLGAYQRMKLECIRADDAIFDLHFSASGRTSRTMAATVAPIVSFAGHSGSGKTTLIEKLIPVLTDAGIKVAVVKHDVHGFEMDKPGKDTWRHKRAGAVATIISSSQQIGLVKDADHDHLPCELAPLLGQVDLIIAEGYKRGGHPKVEVFRPDATGDPRPVCRDDRQLIAIVSDVPVDLDMPRFGLEEITRLGRFLIRHFNLGS